MMKYKFIKQLVIATVIASTLFTINPVAASAAWVQNYDGSWSYTEGYNYAIGWRQINGTWYYFDSNGLMRTGWIYDAGNWYYADLKGAMQKGVIQIEGKIYLFSESGAMQKGSNMINIKLYNFDDNGACVGSDYPAPSRAFDYYGNDAIPYVPNQVINQNASMSKEIPTDGKVHPKQYKVTFKDPDADDDNDEILKTRTVDENIMMPLYKPSKAGYTFVEWNTKSDGDGTSYTEDDKIKIKEDIKLYAQWREADTTDTDSKDTIKVESIIVTSSDGTNKITTQGGSLQMERKISPSDATNQKVTWSVANGTGAATISSSGRLTAVSDGTVTVRAAAQDGSKEYGEVTVTISGQ